MKKAIICSFTLFILLVANAQNKPAYVLYNAKGKKVSYGKMIKQLVQQDIVLIGEFHNNPISHWMELEITKDCKKQKSLVLGAEMFEQDNQPALDIYLQGKLSPKGLDSAARLWKNYTTDYAPLVNFAKENNLYFLQTVTSLHLPKGQSITLTKNFLYKINKDLCYSQNQPTGTFYQLLIMSKHQKQIKNYWQQDKKVILI